MKIPKDWPVQPLGPNDKAKDRATCGNCGLSWDDGISTSMTPTPSARCPFEKFHSGELVKDVIREKLGTSPAIENVLSKVEIIDVGFEQ